MNGRVHSPSGIADAKHMIADSRLHTASSRNELALSGFVLSAALAVVICFVSNNLNGRFQHRQDTIDQQFAILRGEPYQLGGVETYYPQFQNRVLFGLALRGIADGFDLPRGKVYLMLRLSTAVAAFFVFWQLLTQVARAGPRLAATGIGLLGYSLLLTFNHPWEHPTDFLDVIFVALMVWASIRRSYVWLLVLSLIAAANRESSVFGGLVWLFLWARTGEGRWNIVEGVKGLVATGLSGLAVLWLRFLFGGSDAVAGPVTREWIGVMFSFLDFLRAPTPWGWPALAVMMFLPIAWWGWMNRGRHGWMQKRLVYAALVVALLCSFLAIISELRGLIPPLVMALFAAVATEAGFSAEAEERAV